MTQLSLDRCARMLDWRLLRRLRFLAMTLVGVGRSMGGVAAVIPTLNEVETIAGCIASVPRDVVDEVIVADSSSRDGTANVARSAGARVVVLQERGYMGH